MTLAIQEGSARLSRPASAGASEGIVECAAGDVAAAAWDELEGAASEPNVFNGRSFALAYADGFGVRDGLRALCLHGQGGRLDGLFLFERSRRWGLPIPVAQALRHPFSGTSMPLVRAGCEEAAASAFAAALQAGRAGGRAWLLPVIPTDAPLSQALERAARDAGATAAWFDPHPRSVLWPRKGPRQDFAVTGGSKLKKYRQLGRRLAEQGELTYEAVRDEAGIERRLATFFEIEAGGWKGRHGTAAAEVPEHRALMTGAVRGLAARDQCRIDTLLLDGRPIAIAITIESAGTAWLWKVAYDEEFAKYSPYMQLLIHQTLEIVETGLPACCDSAARTGAGPVDRVWHQRREFADLLLVSGSGVPGPRLALLLERSRRRARENAVRARDLVRDRLARLRPAP